MKKWKSTFKKRKFAFYSGDVNYGHSFYFTETKIFGIGSNKSGQLGLTQVPVTKPTQTLPNFKPSDIRKIALGGSYTLIFLKDFRVFVCGENQHGQLGMLNISARNIKNENKKCYFTPIEHTSVKNIRNVFAGCFHSVWAQEEDIYASGYNNKGQLGIGGSDVLYENLSSEFIPKKVIGVNYKHIDTITCGSNYTIFLKKNGNLLKSGAILREKVCHIPSILMSNVKNIYGCLQSIFIVKKNQKVFGMGYNYSKNIGWNLIHPISEPVLISGLHGKNIRDISGGFDHTLILYHDGTMRCLGDKRYGGMNVRADYKNDLNRIVARDIVQIHCGCNNSFVINHSGEVFVAGIGKNWKLGMAMEKSIYKLTKNEFIKNMALQRNIFDENELGMKMLTLLRHDTYIDVLVNIFE